MHTSLVTGLYPFEHGIQGQQDRRIRRGAARLFRQCVERGDRVGLFSEAATIFTGLDRGADVEALPIGAATGVAQVRRWLQTADSRSRCLFLHYWSAHTPYGARDGQAMGETADLLREGHVETVQQRYRMAVEDVFENKVAPLLEALDLSRCAVLLFGDHGESWTSEEFYHGSTVRNSVLRVPLYVHVPYSGNTLARSEGVVSLVDLYSTLCTILDLPRQDDGFGVDLLSSTALRSASRFRMAEIRPGRDPGEDEPIHLNKESGLNPRAALRWTVFDDRYRLHGQDDSWNLEAQWSERSIETNSAALAMDYVEARENFHSQSRWLQSPLEEDSMSANGEQQLRDRLRALGYL